jgi:AcrR family transcriptional regulator
LHLRAAGGSHDLPLVTHTLIISLYGRTHRTTVLGQAEGDGVKNKSWQGDQPADDTEARQRIIAAAMRCLDRNGATKTGISDVATELGVTRQTVYRLFPSTEQLLMAVAAAAADAFVDRMVARVRDETDPAQMLVECLAFTLERLPKERYLSLLVVPERKASFTRGITSAAGFDLTDKLLTRLPVDWEVLGIHGPRRNELIEIWLRTLQSFALEPGPRRTGSQLRALLNRWLAPAVRSHEQDKIRSRL